MTDGAALTHRILIHCPDPAELDAFRAMLAPEDATLIVAPTMHDLCIALDDDIGAVIVAAEALGDATIAPLAEFVANQPAWSDLPFIILTAADREGPESVEGATELRRPVEPAALQRAVRVALRARTRQFDARDRILLLHRREEELRRSEQKFHAITNSVDQMIWSTRPDGFHDYFNDRWYAFTGVPHGSTDGAGWTGLFHPEDQIRTHEVWQQALRFGSSYQIEYRLRHVSGDYRWMLGRAQAVRDTEGRIERWYGTCTDIHEQTEARAALEAYSERLEAEVTERTAALDDLFSKAPVALQSLDADLRLIDVSDRWLQFMGYASREEVLGRRSIEFIDLEGRREDPARDRHQLATTGMLEDVPYVMKKKSGERADVLFSARLVRNEDPALDRIIVAITDVTGRKRAEAARDKAESALGQARKLETIGQLTGGIAHDFNNLLMAIRSSLELLERRLPEGDGRSVKYIANAVRATERGASLTQRMLAFARRQDLTTSAVDVGALLDGMREMMARTLGAAIDLRLEPGEGLARANVDPIQLEMAILNLCVNARDALDGSGTITVTTSGVADGTALGLSPEPYVRITVRDEGIGMDAATLAQSMEPFFTTKGVGKGTGLGLPMVYGFATQSGGTLRLTSAPGKGTEAEIILPAYAGDDRPGLPVEAAPPPAEVRKERLVILAVDDDVLVLMGTVGLLEDLGHEVLESYSGPDALKILEDRPDIDLIITDHAMPKMTGVQLAQIVHQTRPEMPIILASGYAEMPEGGEKHIAARLEKPFGDKGLEKAIKQVSAG